MVGRIIDFETNGNVVKFYLGGGEYYTGDDWDDKPYENNAGKVYDEYIKGTRVMYFDIDDLTKNKKGGGKSPCFSWGIHPLTNE